MKAELHENHLECYEKVYETEKMIELTGESVVSDKMPDIGLLGETITHMFLRVKRTEEGLGLLEGDVVATICYIPDGAIGFQSLDISIPWSVRFESEALKSRQEIIGEASAVQVETRMLNPRKLLVKVQLRAALSAYEKNRVAVCDELNADDDTLCVYKESVSCYVVGTACEKTFAATDEYPLPPDLIGGRILCKTVQFRVDEVKTLANKLIVKGCALSDVVVVTERGDAERISISSGFSFIAETDCENVSADVRFSVMPTAMYYELTSDGKMLSLEAHGVCQMVVYQKKNLQYISDCYSNFYECEMERSKLRLYSDVKKSVHRENITAIMPSRSGISKVLFALCNGMMPNQKGKNLHIPVQISVCVLYENGTSDWLKKQLTLEWKGGEQQSLSSIRVADVYSVSSGTEAEVRVSLELEILEGDEFDLEMISAIEVDEEHPYCKIRPCLTAVRRNGTLWSLAREFGSTPELIRQYNDLEDDVLETETLLLIPKQMR